MKIPEITEISRLVIKPGDRLIVRCSQRLDEATADYVKRRLREMLQLPDDVPLVIMDDGLALQVVAEET